MRFLVFVFFIVTPCVIFSQVNLNNGLVAYYPFNGNANDVSGNNNNPIFNNATLTSDYYGKANSAYHFNGVNNYIEIPNSNSLNTGDAISICVWVKPTGFYAGPCYNNMMVAKQTNDYVRGDYALRYSDVVNGCTNNADSSKETFYGSDGGTGTAQSYIKHNQWYNVVFTSDGTRAKLYVNCKLFVDQPASLFSFGNNYDLFLGHMDNSNYPYWLNGDLDEVRIYNRVLNEDEVEAYSGICKTTTSCSNWARFAGDDPNDPGVQIGDLDIPGNKVTVEALFNRTEAYDPVWYGGDIVSKHTDPSDVNYLLRPTRAEITTTTGYHATPDVCAFGINKTYHVAMVYDGITLKFYRNGFLMSQTPCTGNMILNNWLTTIGSTAAPPDHNPTQFHGYINEVRIWNVARTQQEIRSNMSQSLPNPASQNGLLAYYTFDDLKNKQGNSKWDGNLLNDATTNQTNPECNLVVDSCNQCTIKINAGADISICYKNSTQLKATGAVSYNWDSSNALSDTAIANPVAKPLSTTEFIVTGFDSAKTCSDADTVKVTVLPLPVFSITNDTTVCTGAIIQLNANGNYNFHWSPQNYLSDTSISNPISDPADSIKYYVTATDSSRCKSTDSVQINVVPKPTVLTINDTSICLKTSITLSTVATNANIYAWSPALGLDNNSILNPQASPDLSTVYTISVSNGICIEKDSVLINILALPNVFAGNDTTTCGSGTAQLQASGALNYQWLPANSLSNPDIQNPVASPSSTTTYLVSGTDKNNCISTDSVLVSVLPNPQFKISPQNSAVCLGDSITLSATGGEIYVWNPLQTVVLPNASSTPVFPIIKTTYQVSITDSVCKVKDTLSAMVDIKALPVIKSSKSNDVDCITPQSQLTATGGVSYFWLPASYINNTQIADPVVNPLQDTWYIVKGTGNNSCSAEDSVLIKSNIGSVTGKFYIPNAFTPNGDGINDCFGVKYWGPADFFDMQIYNRWGQEIYHSANIGECWDGEFKGIPQASGVYVYQISVTSVCSQGKKVYKKGTVVLMR